MEVSRCRSAEPRAGPSRGHRRRHAAFQRRGPRARLDRRARARRRTAEEISPAFRARRPAHPRALPLGAHARRADPFPGSPRMTQTQILSRLRELLADTFEIDPSRVTPEADLYRDLDLDSIDAVDLAIKLQEMTGKRIK